MASICIPDISVKNDLPLQELSSEEEILVCGGVFPLVPIIALGVGSAAFGYLVGSDDRRRATGR
jgi:hypothetical protein